MNLSNILLLLRRNNNTGIVARNTLYLTISEIFIKLIGILWIVYIARSLTVYEYGVYSLVVAFIAIFAFLPDLGIGIIVIREIAKHKAKAAEYLGTSFFLNGSLGLIAFVAILVTFRFTNSSPEILPLIVLASCTLFVSTIRSVAIFYFDGLEKMHYSAILNSTNTLLLLGGGVVGLSSGYGLNGVFFGMLCGTVISLLISWATFLRFIRPKFTVDRALIKFFFLQGLPLGIAALATLIYMRVDVIVISSLLGEEQVGIYSAASPFAFALIQLLNMPFIVAVFPALTRIHSEDKKRFTKSVWKSLLVIGAWSFPASFVISLLSPYIIPFIFGSKYDSAIPVLQVLIFYVPFICLSGLLYKVLIIMHKQKLYAVISVCGAVVNLLLNLYLIPTYGIFGAAWAAILTQIILFITYSVFVYTFIKSDEV